MGYIDSIKMVYRTDGFIGFYRGVIPPLAGGVIYRSLQMSGYETMYQKCEHHENMKKTIPFTGGIQYRVIAGAITSATWRSIAECPFEYAKVKRQTGQTWKLADGFTGFGVLYLRSTGLLIAFFSILDSMRRHTKIFNYKVGQFFGTGTAAMVAYWFIWPFEVLKN